MHATVETHYSARDRLTSGSRERRLFTDHNDSGK